MDKGWQPGKTGIFGRRPSLDEEIPLVEWKPLIQLAAEILDRPGLQDYRPAEKLFISLGVLRRINGHPAVFRSEVFAVIKSNKTKID